MMTSSNENIFRVTGPLCGEFTCANRVHIVEYLQHTLLSAHEKWCISTPDFGDKIKAQL